MKIKEKIQKKLDVLEFMMKNDVHIADPNGCMDYSCSISKFWTVLSEEDRDFIQGCQGSIEDGTSWKND